MSLTITVLLEQFGRKISYCSAAGVFFENLGRILFAFPDSENIAKGVIVGFQEPCEKIIQRGNL